MAEKLENMPYEERKYVGGAYAPKLKKDDIKRQQERTQAYEMRLSGMTYPQIGGVLGYAPMTIWRWIKAAIEKQQKPLIDELRTIELDRMDRYLLRLEGEIECGDVKAISTALKISERRCALLGIDAPIKVEGSLAISEASDELQKVIAEARVRIDPAGVLGQPPEQPAEPLELVRGTSGTYELPEPAGAVSSAPVEQVPVSPVVPHDQMEFNFGSIIELADEVQIVKPTPTVDRSILYPEGHPRR